MPKGRGLGLGGEIKNGNSYARGKRWRDIHKLYTDYDWPHLKGWMMSRSWKRHRKTQYKDS
jgi:hypothetical protein